METVQLFVTCLVDAMRPSAGAAAVRVLRCRGATVTFPEGQTCCGQFAYNAGYHREAAALARHFIEVFDANPEPVVALSGSCAAMVTHEYPRLLGLSETSSDDADAWATRARGLAARTVDLSQWLASHGDLAAPHQAMRVALHTGCHMRRLLGAVEEPRRVLEHAGYAIVPMEDEDQCCGFGGTYSMTEPEISSALADSKIAAWQRAESEGAQALVSSDYGCLMHLGGRLSRRGLKSPLWHLAEMVDQADTEQWGGVDSGWSTSR